MSRTITSHGVGGLNEGIVVEALDEPGDGGANHLYQISGLKGPLDHHPIPTTVIRFQKGPLQEVGANGHSNEAYLAVLIDRMRGFQSGRFACEANAIALDHLEQALAALQYRTQQRIRRGVEGTHAE